MLRSRVALAQVKCIDVGVYQLEGKLESVRIVNRQLVNLRPAVRDTPLDCDGLENAMTRISELDASVFGHNVAAWSSQISLRCWVYLQQYLLDLRESGKWAELIEKVVSDALDIEDAYYTTFMFLDSL